MSTRSARSTGRFGGIVSETARVLARQAARWATASVQDENPFVANLHGNYGAAFIFALRQVATDAEVEEATGMSAPEFERRIVAVQDVAARRLLLAAPGIAPRGDVARVAAEDGAVPGAGGWWRTRSFAFGAAASAVGTLLVVGGFVFAASRGRGRKSRMSK